MSLNLEQKQAVVAEVAKEVAGAQAIVMAENRGMPVQAMIQLRAKARASGVYFRVVKNTLVRRAVVGTPFEKLSDQMIGPLTYGIGTDPVAVAKVLNDFAKGYEKLVIKAGAMPGHVMSAKDVAAAVGEFRGGGSEGRFAGMMTAKARSIGMPESVSAISSAMSSLHAPITANGVSAGFASGPSRLNTVRTPSAARTGATDFIAGW